MSGGTLGVAALIGGAFIACGQVAAGTAALAVQGGIATYEQFVIAKECGEAVKKIEAETQKTVFQYKAKSERIVEQLAMNEKNEIAKLKSELRQLGAEESELSVTGPSEIQLVKLMELHDKYISKTPRIVTAVSSTRTPQQIYKNIAEIINPIIAEMPKETRLHRLLFNYLKSAESIAMSNDKKLSDKVAELKQTEQFLIHHIDEYEAIIKSNRYLKEEYIGCTVALKKLADVVGKRVVIEEFNLSEAHRQIENMKKQCEILREIAREKLLNDEKAMAANREMARLIIQAIENVGNKKIAEIEKPYGTESIHQFEKSLIKATTSKDGTVSINVIGTADETDSQLRSDEARFCKDTLNEIVSEMDKLGIEFNITSREYLNSSTICRLDITDIEDESPKEYVSRRSNNMLRRAL